MFEKYPKKVTLKDGAFVTLRPMTRDDEHSVYMFFNSLSETTRQFLRNDVTNRKIIAGWMRDLNYEETIPIIAEYEGKIVANATLHRKTFGWGRHVGEVRIVIDYDFQGRGLGGIILNELCDLANANRLKKLVARIVTARVDAIKAFESSGFASVAVLKNYVKDINQNYADIAIMVKELAPLSKGGY